MQTKSLFGKVKYKLNEQLPQVHYPLKDNMHKAVLLSHLFSLFSIAFTQYLAQCS